MKPLRATVLREHAMGASPGGDLANGLVIFIGICAILYFGQSILMPIVLAILLSLLLGPLVRRLQNIGIPKSVAVLGVVVVVFALLSAATAMVATTLNGLARDLPTYESNLRQKAQGLKSATTGSGTIERAANVLKDLQLELQAPNPGAAPLPAGGAIKPIPVEIRETRFGPLDPILSVMGLLIHPVTQLGIVILMLVFILLNREDLRNRLIRLAGTHDIHRTTTALDEAGGRLSKLFATQLLINVITGTVVGIALTFLGVPGALLWGVLTAILRFIPYVGSMLAAVLPVIIAAAVGEGWTLALLTVGVVAVTEFIVGQVIEPLLLGHMTGISPVAIVVSAAFWAAIWGPIGLILATPMTIGLLVIGRHIEPLKFLDVLLGSEPVLTPEHAFYQRLLAADPLEAAEQADEFIKRGEGDGFLRGVAVPALMLAQEDEERGVLPKEKLISVAETFSAALDEAWSDQPPADARTVRLIAGHGPLNFAATLAFSALLHQHGVAHAMLPEDAILPGRFTAEDIAPGSFVCLCHLVAPSEAREGYLVRRLKPLIGEAKLLAVAWSGTNDVAYAHSPEAALALLPKPPALEAEVQPEEPQAETATAS